MLYRTAQTIYRSRHLLLIFSLGIITSAGFCEHISAEYSLTLTAENLDVNRNTFFEENRGALHIENGPFSFHLDLSLMGDEKYPAHSSFQLGRYFYLNDFSTNVAIGDAGLYAGYMPHADAVETPYSLFVSSLEIPVLNGGFMFTGKSFFYETRWVRVNERSAIDYIGKEGTFRDRGLTLKTFGLDFGNLTIGFEDAYLYMDQSFDAESFLLPVPMYFLEMGFASRNRPWSQDNNVNILMGFFAEWDSGPYYIESQILVDDINASLLAPVLGWAIPALNEIDNLSKLAWNIGGTVQLGIGTIGFYHGGATKYTYEATYTSSSDYSIQPYEYTYYPATEFETTSGDLRQVNYEDNYIGYKYGENNLAFTVTFAAPIFAEKNYGFDLDASAEWVVNGSKSPANPWHEYDNWVEIDPRVELLSDAALEHLLKFQAKATKELKPFEISLSVLLGYGWNRLELLELVDEEPKIFVPKAGNNGILFSVSLSGRYGVEF